MMAPRPGMAAAAGILPVSGGASPAIGGSSTRPVSMAERARMAKIPQLEPGLKCPRCDSTNTKFCYFNNYSLYQPRHFCKTCRRYWTRGGALRNVPVGGGCRRNKRSSKCSKKPASSSSTTTASAAGAKASATCGTSSSAAALMPQQLRLPFGSLHAHHSSCHGIIGGAASRLGLTELSSLHPAAVDYRLGEGLGLERPGLPPVQQFPFITRANTAVPPAPPGPPPLMPAGISYPFGDVEVAGLTDVATAASAGLITHMASVKTDDIDNPPSAATSSPREFLGLSGSFHFCGDRGGGGDGTGGSAATGGAWADLPEFDLSTSGNIL
ncbi:hypothetical protein ABZP36_000549 [Zizania latifolia]